MILREEILDLISRGYKISNILTELNFILRNRGFNPDDVKMLIFIIDDIEDAELMNWDFNEEETYGI